MNTVHFLSQTPEWETPQNLFDELNRVYHFTLDPCATPHNAKCAHFFTREQDGLSQTWDGVVFLNPPYGRAIGKWMQKAYESSLKGTTVVCLVPARTDTRWFHTYCLQGSITFLRGRLKFGNARSSAPFPSMLVVFPGRQP